MGKRVDYLILGQGLAGSLLAWQLLSRGQRVLVIDDGHQSASSTVAAGLINPVTGKRLVKTIGVDECLPLARDHYRQLECLLECELWVDKPMLRLFHSEKERERWQQRNQEQGYRDYLGEIIEPAQLPRPVTASHGGGLQKQTAYLRTAPLLQGLREWLQQQGCYRDSRFEHNELELHPHGVSWKDIEASTLIFCEGYKGAQNPWFGQLPFQPAKGEFLRLQSNDELPEFIINSGRWLMPRGDGHYRCGATYDHEQFNEESTVEARKVLLDALPGFLSPLPKFKVVEQQAGVRPTTSDRQPFMGRHPRYPQLAIFNGFGSKGSLLIPWHAERMAELLLEGRKLPKAIDIERYRERLHG